MRGLCGARMSAAIASRTKPAAVPLGTGELHQALEAAGKAAALHDFCRATGTSVDEVSSDGISLDVLRIFDAMRTRGFELAKPRWLQHQAKKGFTAWGVHVRKSGVEFDLAFYTANEP